MDHRTMAARGWLMVLAMTLPAASGCAALVIGTAAAGGAVGYAYYKGNVARDHPGSFGQVWLASLTAVKKAGFPILVQRLKGPTGEIESVTEQGDRIYIYVEPIQPRTTTRVHIRVGWFGDHELSNYLHDRIADALVGVNHSMPLAPSQPAPPNPLQPTSGRSTVEPPRLSPPPRPTSALPTETPPPPVANAAKR